MFPVLYYNYRIIIIHVYNSNKFTLSLLSKLIDVGFAVVSCALFIRRVTNSIYHELLILLMNIINFN